MSKELKWLRILTAFAVILVALFLCWTCIDIYLDSHSPENLDLNALHMINVFSWEVVSARLGEILLPLSVCAMVVIASIAVHAFVPSKTIEVCAYKSGKYSEKVQYKSDCHNTNPTRLLFLAVAFIFIVLGMINGGLHDVLVKAINICTECIGLG